MIGAYSTGDMQMIDIASYFKAHKLKWVKLLLEKTPHINWKVIPSTYLDNYGKNFLILETNNPISLVDKLKLHKLPTFNKEVLVAWVDYGGGYSAAPKTFHDIRKQTIWGNSFIQLNNKPLFFKSWINSDIIFVNDLLDENGNITSNQVFNKLQHRHNWMAEFTIISKAIPPAWKHALQTPDSEASRVKQQNTLSPCTTSKQNKTKLACT
jgi:hypothetical protein